jgi:hypothetical protein
MARTSRFSLASTRRRAERVPRQISFCETSILQTSVLIILRTAAVWSQEPTGSGQTADGKLLGEQGAIPLVSQDGACLSLGVRLSQNAVRIFSYRMVGT